MLFKLSLKNIRKSFKDYAIYFVTLILAVAIFYVFNAINSQGAFLEISDTKKQILELMNTLLGGLSIFISFVLGFLIIFANKFIIKRRKKEFGIYMTLGMGKGHISKILLIETILIGIISLIAGAILGIFASQFMSILVAKMFEVDMAAYTFTFSNAALIKTIIYFSIMYFIIMIFNIFAVHRYKLINLITAIKQNEKIKIKHPTISIIIFIIAIGILSYAYYMVTNKMMEIDLNTFIFCIALGVIGTILFFWSMSGFILRLVQSSKLYLKDLNMFVLRQINSKINTTVFSMSVICILLFLTITIFSSALSLNKSARLNLEKQAPVDFQAINYDIEDKKDLIEGIRKDLKDITEFKIYMVEEITLEKTLGKEGLKHYKKELDIVPHESAEILMTLSDYNKVAKMFGNKTYTLKEGEYIVVADYDAMIKYRNIALKNDVPITIDGKKHKPKYTKTVPGFIEISASQFNLGVFVFPDKALSNIPHARTSIIANYKVAREDTEKKVTKYAKDNHLYAATKTEIYDAAVGIGGIVTFIGLYLGIVFLISSAAILALKELSESSDNKERYQVLRKIGADDKMINRSLFVQIGIFFLMPLILAIIHSIFGIICANNILSVFGNDGLVSSIIMTALFIILIYGGYFILTYFSSKRIIKE